jgi:ABC-type sugar transport system ATPase subunit
MAPVTFERVTKRFGETTAVDDVTLEVRDGEFMVLVGPSGCGKTTALRCLAGLEAITSGAIRIGNRDVTHVAPRERDIAMVFQDYALYPQMSVRKNLAFGLTMRKLPKADIERRVSEAAELLEIGPLLERKPRELSAGSASASRSAARSCATRRSSSWTSRSRTSTPSCARRPAPTSARCSSGSRSRRSTSRTTRSRR